MSEQKATSKGQLTINAYMQSNQRDLPRGIVSKSSTLRYISWARKVVFPACPSGLLSVDASGDREPLYRFTLLSTWGLRSDKRNMERCFTKCT